MIACEISSPGYFQDKHAAQAILEISNGDRHKKGKHCENCSSSSPTAVPQEVGITQVLDSSSQAAVLRRYWKPASLTGQYPVTPHSLKPHLRCITICGCNPSTAIQKWSSILVGNSLARSLLTKPKSVRLANEHWRRRCARHFIGCCTGRFAAACHSGLRSGCLLAKQKLSCSHSSASRSAGRCGGM